MYTVNGSSGASRIKQPDTAGQCLAECPCKRLTCEADVLPGADPIGNWVNCLQVAASEQQFGLSLLEASIMTPNGINLSFAAIGTTKPVTTLSIHNVFCIVVVYEC